MASRDDEHRLLVVLFTDAVGSSATRLSLGDADADVAMHAQDKLVRGLVEDHGGLYVKNLGDGVMATFMSASAAVAAAAAIQRGNCRSRQLPGVFPLRIGLSVGDVLTHADGDVFGTPVVEASRLCLQARSGQILAKATIMTLIGTRATVSFRDVGALNLKGLPDLVPVVEVDWLSAPGSTWLVFHERHGARVVDLTELATTVVGAAHDCDVVVVAERSVSRNHCRFSRHDDVWRVQDLQSRNGTVVNGKPVEDEHILGDGDMIQLGALEIEFHEAAVTTVTTETDLFLRDAAAGIDPDDLDVLRALCQPLLDGDALSTPATLTDVATVTGRSVADIEVALNRAGHILSVRAGSWRDLAHAAVIQGVIG